MANIWRDAEAIFGALVGRGSARESKLALPMMPHQYTAMILERPRRRRAELLDRVPVHLQGLVQTHLEMADAWDKHERKTGKKRVVKRKESGE